MKPLAPVMQIRAMAGDRLSARRQRFQRAPAGRCVGEDGVALGRIVAIALLLGVMTCAAALTGTRAVPDSRAAEMVTARTRGAGPLTSVTAIRRARRFAASRQGRVAFVVLDEEHRPRGLLRTAHFPSASVSKAMLLVAMLRRAPTRSLNDGERNLLRPMITVSDNDAASAIYAKVGGDGLRRVAKAAGMRQFADVGHWAEARITAADQARLFLRIDRLVPRRHRRYARKLLCSIVGEQRWGIAPVARHSHLEDLLQGRLAERHRSPGGAAGAWPAATGAGGADEWLAVGGVCARDDRACRRPPPRLRATRLVVLLVLRRATRVPECPGTPHFCVA